MRSGVRRADVLILDLTDDPTRRAGLLRSLPLDERAGLRTLAFYSHVEADVRLMAEEAGFDLVVPRSRMAREGASLIAGLVSK